MVILFWQKKINLKIHILYKTSTSPWGGGNQFLDYLKSKLKKKNCYANEISSDVILFNSHHDINNLLKLKYIYQDTKKFVHRIDGPIKNYRNDGYRVDKLIFLINKYLADGTIFQSNYSLKKTKLLTNINNPIKIIYNEANKKFFFKKRYKYKSKNKKINLLSVSWSDNMLKGFKYLKYLDDNLDFDKYKMNFIGNTPVKFKNINIIPPVKSKELGKRIRQTDIFIFPSIVESCSNTLLEAMSCRVPVVALNSSSNPEIFNGYGKLFDNKKDLIKKINTINFKIKHKIKNEKKQNVENLYINFFKKNFKRKKLNFFILIFLRIYLLKFYLIQKLKW